MTTLCFAALSVSMCDWKLPEGSFSAVDVVELPLGQTET